MVLAVAKVAVMACVLLVPACHAFHALQPRNFVWDTLYAYLTRNYQEDALLTCDKLISKRGYPVEAHNVVTADGYILTIFRIPYGRKSGKKIPNTKPVVIQPGLPSSCDDWVLGDPDKSLVFMLADMGYDVWLANARGNKYSRRHVKLKPNQRQFWDFSFHEIGKYDVPAIIDYILSTAGVEKMHFVGHSMGTTTFFVFGSERPEYNSKLRATFLLAPSAYQDHISNGTRKAAYLVLSLRALEENIGHGEVLPGSKINPILAHLICANGAPLEKLCNIILLGGVSHPEKINKTKIAIGLSHYPSGGSLKTFIHYAQNIKSGVFRQFDYGWINLLKYGTAYPPAYNLTRITSPVALVYAENDGVLHPKDTARMGADLPNLIGMYRAPSSKFNHFDFVTGSDITKLLYDSMISIMDNY